MQQKSGANSQKKISKNWSGFTTAKKDNTEKLAWIYHSIKKYRKLTWIYHSIKKGRKTDQ